MELFASPRYIVLLVLVGITFLFYAYLIADVALNPDKYESSFFQFFIAFLLIAVFAINGFILINLFSPKETVEDKEVVTYYITSPPRQISISSMAIDYIDDEDLPRHLILEAKDYEKLNTQEKNLTLTKMEQIKKQEFFILGKKIDENSIKLKEYYKLEDFEQQKESN